MSRERVDTTGAPVSLGVDAAGPVGHYTVQLDDGRPAGRADFVDPAGGEERIFFHTEVDPELGGRGLARLLVEEALGDSIREELTVVPVCPVFARHLLRHGDEFVADGGSFRRPRASDLALVSRAAGSGA